MSKQQKQKWIKFTVDEQLYEKIKNRKYKQLADNVREDLQAYYAVLERGFNLARKKLTANEALAIVELMSTHIFTAHLAYIYAEEELITMLEDACVLEDLDKKWKIDKNQVIEKIKSLSSHARLALADWAVAFAYQHQKNLHDKETQEKVQKLFRAA